MPILDAVSSSTRQLFGLLQCISFAAKAEVAITSNGLRFSVEDSRVIQGLAFLHKSLFTTYNYSPPPPSNEATADVEDSERADNQAAGHTQSSVSLPLFTVPLAAILEILKIVGTADPSRERNYHHDGYSVPSANPIDDGHRGGSAAAFDNQILGLASTCRFTYEDIGKPLQITLEEGSVKTTCDLSLYEPDEFFEDIPFQRDRVCQKIIMRSSALYDAISELSSFAPETLTMLASPYPPYFGLSSNGSFGSASVEFDKDSLILSTFQVGYRSSNVYKFSLFKAALKAMSVAAQVSVRRDVQGVLSLQFLIETETSVQSFMDFRFVPLSEESDGHEERDEGQFD